MIAWAGGGAMSSVLRNAGKDSRARGAEGFSAGGEGGAVSGRPDSLDCASADQVGPRTGCDDVGRTKSKREDSELGPPDPTLGSGIGRVWGGNAVRGLDNPRSRPGPTSGDDRSGVSGDGCLMVSALGGGQSAGAVGGAGADSRR